MYVFFMVTIVLIQHLQIDCRCVPTINSVLFVPGASNMLLCSSIEYDHRNRHFLFDATEGFLLESDSWGMHTDDDSPMWRPTTDIQSVG